MAIQAQIIKQSFHPVKNYEICQSSDQTRAVAAQNLQSRGLVRCRAFRTHPRHAGTREPSRGKSIRQNFGVA